MWLAKQSLQLQSVKIDIHGSLHALGTNTLLSQVRVCDVQVHVGLFTKLDCVSGRKSNELLINQPTYEEDSAFFR
jgi:hypothetical protein